MLLCGELLGKLCNRGPVGNVEGNRMHIGQPIEAAQGAVGSSGGVDVPPSLAHVFGDRQTDAYAGAGNQYGRHVFSSLVVMGDDGIPGETLLVYRSVYFSVA